MPVIRTIYNIVWSYQYNFAFGQLDTVPSVKGYYDHQANAESVRDIYEVDK